MGYDMLHPKTKFEVPATFVSLNIVPN